MGVFSERCPMLQRTASPPLSLFRERLSRRSWCRSTTKLAGARFARQGPAQKALESTNPRTQIPRSRAKRASSPGAVQELQHSASRKRLSGRRGPPTPIPARKPDASSGNASSRNRPARCSIGQRSENNRRSTRRQPSSPRGCIRFRCAARGRGPWLRPADPPAGLPSSRSPSATRSSQRRRRPP